MRFGLLKSLRELLSLAWHGALGKSRRDDDGRPRIYVVRGAHGYYACESRYDWMSRRLRFARRCPSRQRAAKVAKRDAGLLGGCIEIRKVVWFGLLSVLVEELRV